jgi:hypothetical protein
MRQELPEQGISISKVFSDNLMELAAGTGNIAGLFHHFTLLPYKMNDYLCEDKDVEGDLKKIT